MPRITIACPDNLRSDANQLAVILGDSLHEITTFGECSWQDSSGNLYSCASLEVSEQWLDTVQDLLYRPTWDTDAQVDLAAAQRAHDLLHVHMLQDDQVSSRANANQITMIVGVDGVQALDIMGLSPHNFDQPTPA